MIWTCSLHGPLKYRFELSRWECPGYDGEGCTVVTGVTGEEQLEREGPR